jgi:general secretion pathway protein C
MLRRFVVGMSLVSALGVAQADELPAVICKATPANQKIVATFSPETSIKDLVTWLVGFTCKNVVIDADVHAHVQKVSIVAPKPMTPKQATDLFIDAVKATGLEVVSKKDTMIIKLGPKMPKNCPAPTTVATAPQVPIAPADAPPALDEEMTKLFDEGIKTQKDGSVQISKKVIDAVLANPMSVAKGARVVPAVKDGKPDGFKLYAIRPSSVYAKLGLTNGDTLQSINGFELTSADKALEVYTKLREATQLQVEITRRGKPVTLNYSIR